MPGLLSFGAVSWPSSPRVRVGPPLPFSRASIQRSMMATSSSVCCGWASIGTWPQTPLPPRRTFLLRRSSAPGCFRYLSAMATNDGPTSWVSTAWQLKQSLWRISERPGSTATALPSAGRNAEVTSVRAANSAGLASEVPSSASCAATLKSSGLPGVKKSPSCGVRKRTVGMVLPTTTGVVRVTAPPWPSVTVSSTLKLPAASRATVSSSPSPSLRSPGCSFQA